MKLEKWEHAIDDCNFVLKHEKNNVKALLRRSTAYFKKKQFDNAKSDIEKCLSIEENNKKALVSLFSNYYFFYIKLKFLLF